MQFHKFHSCSSCNESACANESIPCDAGQDKTCRKPRWPIFCLFSIYCRINGSGLRGVSSGIVIVGLRLATRQDALMAVMEDDGHFDGKLHVHPHRRFSSSGLPLYESGWTQTMTNLPSSCDRLPSTTKETNACVVRFSKSSG